jgi:thiamine biosynthesis lipoprotein
LTLPLDFYELDFQAMGTACAISIYAESADSARAKCEPVVTDVARLEAKYSRYLSDSFLSLINLAAKQGRSIEVDDETASLLDYAQTCHAESKGLVDSTSGLLRRAGTFQPEGQTAVPDAASLENLLERVGWQKLDWHAPKLAFTIPGMELDFGGIVKEYAADRAATLLKEQGVAHALVNLGGDICVTGPQADDRPWRVAISDPSSPTQELRIVEVSQGALASSGSNARCIEIEGIRYGHLLNPRTGFPVKGTLAATVVADQCVVAGSLATIALLNETGAARFLKDAGLPFLLISSDGDIDDRL